MLFSNRTNYEYIENDIVFDDSIIGFRDSARILGLKVDNKLKFDSHLSNIAIKLSNVVGIIYRLSTNLPQKTLVKLCYGLFYPHILYANLIWGETYAIHLNVIEILEKKVVRIITGSAYLAHTSPLFFKTKILKINDVHPKQKMHDLYATISIFLKWFYQMLFGQFRVKFFPNILVA